MDFLKDVGIDSDIIDMLNKNLPTMEKDFAIKYKDSIISSINYLKEIGITDKSLNEIIDFDFHVLVPGKEKLEKAVSKCNKENLVKCINYDAISYIKYLKNF